MKNLLKKLNVIFTGRYLKFWYIAFAATVLIMLVNWQINLRTTSFELTLFTPDGKIENQRVLSKDELGYMLPQLPFTKSFKPLK